MEILTHNMKQKNVYYPLPFLLRFCGIIESVNDKIDGNIIGWKITQDYCTCKWRGHLMVKKNLYHENDYDIFKL